MVVRARAARIRMPTFLDQPIILLISEIVDARLRVVLVAVYLIGLRRGDLVHERPVAHDVMAAADRGRKCLGDGNKRGRTSRRWFARRSRAMWEPWVVGGEERKAEWPMDT